MGLTVSASLNKCITNQDGFNHVNVNGFCCSGGQKTGGFCSMLETKWSIIDGENDDNQFCQVMTRKYVSGCVVLIACAPYPPICQTSFVNLIVVSW